MHWIKTVIEIPRLFLKQSLTMQTEPIVLLFLYNFPISRGNYTESTTVQSTI